MKISKETMDILKNFAAINMSILIREGKKIKTITPQKNVMAIATVEEEFPREFAIYDLNQFLGTASLFADAEFDFGEKSVTISSGSSKAKYMYAAKEAIVFAPEKDIAMPQIEVDFKMEEKALSSALKAASVMGLPHVTITGRDGKVFLTATDSGNDSTHQWEQEVGETASVFNLIYRLDLLKFLPRDYKVSVTAKLITKFESTKGDVVYFAAAETGSKFG